MLKTVEYQFALTGLPSDSTNLRDRVIGSRSLWSILWLDCLEVLEETELLCVLAIASLTMMRLWKLGHKSKACVGSDISFQMDTGQRARPKGIETRVTSKCSWVHWQVLEFLFMNTIAIFSWSFQKKMVIFEESRSLSWKQSYSILSIGPYFLKIYLFLFFSYV